MDKETIKNLGDKQYERRKKAATEIERIVREALLTTDPAPKINQIISQLAVIAASPESPHNSRIGGAMGLAAVSLALGPVHLAEFLPNLVPPIATGLKDTSSAVRYFDLESMYNVTKVAKGDILPWFNELFDALSVLVCDSDSQVRSGTELLDRLLKDIVAEQASTHLSLAYYQEPLQGTQTASGHDKVEITLKNVSTSSPVDEAPTDKQVGPIFEPPVLERAFNLERFIPLLSDRLSVLASPTQMFLCSWIAVFNSIPDLSLVTYLPRFMHALFRYLGDDIDIEIVQEALALLGQFLKEIETTEAYRQRKLQRLEDRRRHFEERKETLEESEDLDVVADEDEESDDWVPETDDIDYEGIVAGLVKSLESYYDEITIQNTILKWLQTFLRIIPQSLVPFIPRLTPFILKSLSHETPFIRDSAARVDEGLRSLILSLPDPISFPPQTVDAQTMVATSLSTKDRKTASPTPSAPSANPIPFPTGVGTTTQLIKNKNMVPTIPTSHSADSVTNNNNNKNTLLETEQPSPASMQNDKCDVDLVELLDWDSTIHALHVLFVHDNKRTRVAAMEWLMMLHRKAPNKITAAGPVFPSLLTCLSDESDEVIMTDLHLVAQILGSSPEQALRSYLIDLLKLLASDRRLLENRGTLIIRLLCDYLDTESVYKMLAELLEKDVVQDLDFCSAMVQNLTMILLTTPEMGDFRRKLKNLDTREGQVVFTVLYRSWSHNAVATFALCLLAQAYEHAANLLQTFGELEVTVSMLIQIDKFVSLLESPVFTALRLQLLEPEKYPYLFKALYGLLMLLPQSSAFTMLRNRLNSVSALGFLHVAQRAPAYTSQTSANSRASTMRRDELRWSDLLTHFRTVQLRHERARGRASYYENEVFDQSFSRQPSQGLADNQPKTMVTKKKTLNSTPTKSETGSVGNFLSAIQPRRRFPSLKR